MWTTQSVGMQVYNGFMLNENINQWKWNYQLVKSADNYSLTVVCWTGRIYEKKIILKNNEIQLYLDTGKKWIDKKLKIFETRNKEASYTRLFYIFNWNCWQNQNKWYI